MSVASGRSNPGHVFVIRGDLRNLACSAWMQTTDKRLRPGGRWQIDIPDAAERITSEDRAAFEAEQVFSIPVWPKDGVREPIPYLTAVPFHGVRTADGFRPRIRAFVEAAAPLAHSKPVIDRPRPLLAIPPIGFGRGGGALRKGDVIRVVLDEARVLAAEFDVDIAIVLRDGEKAYALAQHLRKKRGTDSWPELTAAEVGHAQRLGGLARHGRLVPFMGAGVSVSAGAPTWAQLMERLADVAGLQPSVRSALFDEDRNVLDQATFLRQAIEKNATEEPSAFARAIATFTDVRRYGLAPALLAALDIEQAITLNYDTLFERAAEDGGLPRRRIPGARAGEALSDRWLLKLHGTIDEPASIVLTRSDYLGFNAERAALSSIVKATLMTRHVLFVGFGMTDDHFHEIIHDVRKAVLSSGSSPVDIGTVLTLKDDLLDRTLLSELEFVPFSSGAPDPDYPAAARRLEIFLDAMLAHASDAHSYLLDKTYTDGLTDDERVLRDRLLALVDELPPRAKSTTSWGVLDSALHELGFDGDNGDVPGREGRAEPT